VWVETAAATEVRVAVTSAPDPMLRVRGSQACHRFGRCAVGDAPPEGADKGVDVQ
jgi:hypothetical protein